MVNKPNITSIQLALLTGGSALMFPYTFLPIIRTPPANQDVWIVLLLSLVFIVILNTPLLIIMNKLRGLTINEVNDIIMGKYLGKVTVSTIALFGLFCYVMCTILSILFVMVYVMPNTPSWAILLMILVPTSYAAIKGAGTIARLATFIMPFVILTILVFFVMGIPDMKVDALLPIIASSTIWELVQGSFFTASRFTETLLFFVFVYFLTNQVSINRSYAKSIVLWGVSIMLLLIPVLLVVGSDFGKIVNNPYYIYTRQVGGDDVFQRVQSFNILAWFTGITLKLTAYLYITVYIIGNFFPKLKRKHIVLATSLLVFIGMIATNIIHSGFFHLVASDDFFPLVTVPVVFIVPLILMIVYFVRKKKIEPKLQQMLQAKQQQESDNA